MTVPAGNPIWSHSASAAVYGGSATKRDYGGIGAVNANTDITAAQYMRLVADAAASAMMAPICLMQLTRTSTPAILVDYIMPVWTERWFVQYDGGTPPSSLYPSATILDGTTVELAFPTSAADAYGVTADISVTLLVPLLLGSFWIPVGVAGVARIGGFNDAESSKTCQVLVF